jgi:hypothetical protein
MALHDVTWHLSVLRGMAVADLHDVAWRGSAAHCMPLRLHGVEWHGWYGSQQPSA